MQNPQCFGPGREGRPDACSKCDGRVAPQNDAKAYLQCAAAVCVYRTERFHQTCSMSVTTEFLLHCDAAALPSVGFGGPRCMCDATLEPTSELFEKSLWTEEDRSASASRALDEMAACQREQTELYIAAASGGLAAALTALVLMLVHLCLLFGPLGPGTTATLVVGAFMAVLYWGAGQYSARTRSEPAKQFASDNAIAAMAQSGSRAPVIQAECRRYSKIAATCIAACLLFDIAAVVVAKLSAGSLFSGLVFASFFLVFTLSGVAFMWPLWRLHRLYIDSRYDAEKRERAWALIVWARHRAAYQFAKDPARLSTPPDFDKCRRLLGSGPAEKHQSASALSGLARDRRRAREHMRQIIAMTTGLLENC